MAPVVIINADDLGRSECVDRGIFRAHAEGIVSSATLMVNAESAESAAMSLVRFPRLGVGLHTQLSGGIPLLPPAELPSLTAADGRFHRRPDAFCDLREAEVRAEVRAQYARFERLVGRPPTHLDSHHHAHRHPVVRSVVLELAEDEGLPVRRIDPRGAPRLVGTRVRTTDVFEERFYGVNAQLEVLLDVLTAAASGGVTEVMCHPGESDQALRDTSAYADDRLRELEILCSVEVREALAKSDLELATFAALSVGSVDG